MKNKINEIASILGLLNNSNYEEANQSYHTLKLTDLVNMCIYHDSYRKKFNVSLTYSKASGLSYSTCYASFDGISLSDNREASSLAKDIKRRIMVEKNKEVDEYCQKVIDSVSYMNEIKNKELESQKINYSLNEKFKGYKDGAHWNLDKSMYFTLSAKELTQDQIEQILKIAGF